MRKYHKFHILRPALWPLLVSIELLLFLLSFLAFLNSTGMEHAATGQRCIIIIILIGITIFAWFRDITIEGVFNRYHTDKVSKSLRLGALLFIVSEIMLFAGFFWAWFHSSLAPSHIIGCVWPPYDLKPLDPYKIPLLNTALLLTSGATITATHHAFLSNFPKRFVMITFISK